MLKRMSIGEHSAAPRSRHHTTHVDTRRLIFCFSFIFPPDCQPGYPVKVIPRIFPWAVDQQVFLLIDEVLPFVFTHLEIGGKLDRICGACLLAKAAKDTA